MRVVGGEYREGDAALLKARPWVARLTGAKFDHAALLWLRGDDWYTVEAGLTGVRAYPIGHWPREFAVFRPNSASASQGQMAATAGLRRLGERYAFENLTAIVRKMLRRRVGIQAVVCTELVQQAWERAGIVLCDGNLHPTPDELWAGLMEETGAVSVTWPPAYYVDPPPTDGKPIDGTV